MITMSQIEKKLKEELKRQQKSRPYFSGYYSNHIMMI